MELNRGDKIMATLGAAITLGCGVMLYEGYDHLQQFKRACAALKVGEAACAASPPTAEIRSDNNIGNDLGIVGAIGLGAGLMLGAVALAKEPAHQDEELLGPIMVPFGHRPPDLEHVIVVPLGLPDNSDESLAA